MDNFTIAVKADCVDCPLMGIRIVGLGLLGIRV